MGHDMAGGPLLLRRMPDRPARSRPGEDRQNIGLILPRGSPITRLRMRRNNAVQMLSCSSRGLGHRPLTAVTGVRIPYGTPAFLIFPLFIGPILDQSAPQGVCHGQERSLLRTTSIPPRVGCCRPGWHSVDPTNIGDASWLMRHVSSKPSRRTDSRASGLEAAAIGGEEQDRGDGDGARRAGGGRRWRGTCRRGRRRRDEVRDGRAVHPWAAAVEVNGGGEAPGSGVAPGAVGQAPTAAAKHRNQASPMISAMSARAYCRSSRAWVMFGICRTVSIPAG